MYQLRLQAKFILKHIILVNTLRLHRLNIIVTVNHINQALISNLELAFQFSMILIWNQISLSKGCIWFQAKLRCIHKRTKERHLAALL